MWEELDTETPKGGLTGHFMDIKYVHFRTIVSKTYLHLFLIAVIGFLAYSNTFHVLFVLDDIKHIEKNLMLRDLDNFLRALKGHVFDQSAYEYLPSRFVGYLSFALNYHFGGARVEGYHLVNLFIHIANAMLVYFLALLTFRTPYFSNQQSAVRRKNSLASSKKEEAGNDGPNTDDDSLLTTHYLLFTNSYSPFTLHDSRSSAFIALFSALLFVSHPVQTQAVTYVVQRFASLATLFYLLSLVMYIKGRRAMGSGLWEKNLNKGRLITEKAMGYGLEAVGEKSPTDKGSLSLPIAYRLLPIAYYFLSLLSAVLAMKTKEIAYTLPLVIILYESVFFTAPLKKKLLFFLPIVLILISVLVGVIHSDRPLGEVLSDINEQTRVKTVMPRWDYLVTEMRVVITYIRLIFLPINQNLDYDYPTYHSLFALPVLFSFLFLLALFGAAVWLLYRSRQGATASSKKLVVSSEQTKAEEERTGNGSPSTAHYSLFTTSYSPFTIHYSRLVGFGILWFFITISVESSVIPIVDVIFEHRVYLPSIGLLMAITAGLFAVAAKFKKVMSLSLILILTTLAFAAATYARNNIWKDDASLWEDVVRKSPNKARPHNYLGEIYSRQGRLDEAIREYQIVLSLNYDYDFAHNNLGIVYAQQGRLDEAAKEFQEVLRLKPGNAHAHNNLGVIYDQLGRPAEAIKEYQIALRLYPDHADAHYNLGAVFERQGRPAEAIKEYQAALRLNPDYSDAHIKIEVLNKQLKSKNY